MITGLKYPPLKSAVNKVEQLPRVLFYKASGCKNAECAKGAEGLYNAVDTTTGNFLGSIDVSTTDQYLLHNLGADYGALSSTLHGSGYLYKGGQRIVKLPYSKEYENVYHISTDEAKNLTSEEQSWFASQGLQLLKNLSDKFKRPLVLGKDYVSGSMKLEAIGDGEFVAIPHDCTHWRARKKFPECGRAIDGKEMGERCNYLISDNNIYCEQTYKNVDKYLEKKDIDSLVYAEYAVHPKVRKPSLTTAAKEFFIDTKRIFSEIRRDIRDNLNKEVKVSIE